MADTYRWATAPISGIADQQAPLTIGSVAGHTQHQIQCPQCEDANGVLCPGLMSRPTRLDPADVLGFSRLAVEATSGMAGVVEAMHAAIAGNILPGTPSPALIALTSAAVYGTVRAFTGVAGGGIDAMLSHFDSTRGRRPSTPEREALLAGLNGILGDHLAAAQNPLAIPMCLRRRGRPLQLQRERLAAAIPQASGKLLVLVHGLCMNDLQWTRRRHNHGAALAAELGWTPVYLHYNSGLHVSTNGRAFAALLEDLVAQWPAPVKELAIIGHSCGGLLARSAHYYGHAARYRWPKYLRWLVFLGTPHQGSPLERCVNWVHTILGSTPYSSPLARIAAVRSAGITDLRYGNLVDEDWQGTDRFHDDGDHRHPFPLPKRVRCSALAATKAKTGEHVGDGLVSVDSALGRHANRGNAPLFAESRQWVGHGLSHWDLLSHPTVYRRIRDQLASLGTFDCGQTSDPEPL